MAWYESRRGKVELTDERWRHIVTFHPDIKPNRRFFTKTILEPINTRRSAADPNVYILYRLIPKTRKYLAIVVKRITATSF